MDLSTLSPKVKKRKPKRKGRGPGSGGGKTGGRGHKGTGQRSGKGLYVGFAGGNISLMRRIPKRGFTAWRKIKYQIVNLKDIEARLNDKTEISPKELKEANLIKSDKKPVKILAKNSDTYKLKAAIKVHKFSKKTAEIVEKAGGKIECLSS